MKSKTTFLLFAALGLLIAVGVAMAFSAQNDGEVQLEQETPYSKHLDGANIGSTAEALDSTDVSVDIIDFTFEPTILKIKAGTTVTWTNKDKARHDITISDDSPSKGPSSELLSQNQTYSYTFNDSGVYLYFCSPHPSQMRAVVEVIN